MVQRTIGLFCIVVFVVSLLSFSACTRSRVKDDELYDEQAAMKEEAIRYWEGRKNDCSNTLRATSSAMKE